MTHLRTQVRKAVSALLEPIAGIVVFQNLARKPDADELPVMSIRTPSESAEQHSADENVRRRLNIIISIMANSRDDAAQDMLDGFSVEVEKKMFNTDLGGLLFDEIQLTNTDLEVFDEGADKIAFLHMGFTAIYITAAGNPEIV